MALWAGAAVGQVAPIDPETRVRSVRFVVDGAVDASPDELRTRIATRGQGRMVALRRALGWLPFVAGPSTRRLDPFELQRDKERLRRYLARIGYPEAAVDYDVTFRQGEGAVDVTFRVRPGPPVVLGELAVAWIGAGPPELDPAATLADLRSRPGLRPGEPLDSTAIPSASTAVLRWLGERGHPFATVTPDVMADSGRVARVVLRTDPGPRARIGRVDVVGIEDGHDMFLRFSGVRQGDWFSLSQLEHAADRVSALSAVRRAVFEVPRGQTVDTLVDVVLRVREESLRVISGEAGYASDGGLAGDAQWTHRNVFGGAQSLTATVAGQSGLLALGEDPERYVRAGLALRQPLRSLATLTLDVGPFVVYRNDFRDRSVEYGLEATLIQRLGPLTSVALHYELSTRRVYEYRFGDIAAGFEFVELLTLGAQGVLDTLGTRIGRSALSLSSSLGTLDAPTEPTRGWVLEPSLTITAPEPLTSVQYATANLRASAYLPVSGSLTLAGRLGGGRVFPFGKSIPPTPEAGLTQYLRLRDVLFTAGGADDVRGWSDRMLGPKFPEVVLTAPHSKGKRFGTGLDGALPSVLLWDANRYVPLGGFQRVHATAEARLALPFLGPAWATHAFVDAGRVWTRDDRFTDDADPYGVEKLFWSVGGGVDYSTAIGTLRIALGYKMNPSVLDLARPEDVTRALLQQAPLDTVRRYPWRRLQIHIGLGTRL